VSRRIELANHVALPGDKVLSFSATPGTFGILGPGGTHLLAPGKAITNATLPSAMWVMTDTPGTATLTYSFTGTGIASNFNCSHSITITAIKIEAITFQNPNMPTRKIVPDYKHLGVFTGQSAKFGVITNPNIPIPDGLLTWGGLASGNTAEVNVLFNILNADRAPVTVSLGGVTLTAHVATRDEPMGTGEMEYALNNWSDTLTLLSLNIIGRNAASLEPTVWAAAAYPGNQANTRADAARHAYWTCLMTRYANADYALGLSSQHEVPPPGQTAVAVETVMDLHNNMRGVEIAESHVHNNGDPNIPGSNFQCCRDAVQNAVSSGVLWYMDDPSNWEQRALLQPTDK